MERHDDTGADVQYGWPSQAGGGGLIQSTGEILVINIFKISGLLLVDLGHTTLDPSLEQGLNHFAASGTTCKVTDAIDVGETHNDQFKSVKTLVGFDHQLLRHLGVAVSFAGSTMKILIDRAVAFQTTVVGAHGANLHQPFDSRESHRLGHIDGSHDIDL